ncbi:MAG TPA: aldo/keto reductase [bacterium]|nr:aldo/keto reductase [bacterium]
MDRFSRRQFLSRGSIAMAALGAGAAFPVAGWTEEKKGMRTLGRTELQVSQISFGGLQIGTSALLHGAIDNGINLVHVCPVYQGGNSIRIYGEVMKDRRKEVYLALKGDPSKGIDESLKILNTDYVDILIPEIGTVEEISNPELPGGFEKLKKEGKIRFSGFAAHKDLPEILEKAIELGFYDVMMPSYNTGNRAVIDPLLEKAKKEQQMGFMGMKVLRGIQKEGSKSTPEEVKGFCAELLKNPQVDTLLMGMASFEDLKTNTEACFQKYSQAMPEGLKEKIRYAEVQECGSCGTCSKACPHGVATCDIMRLEYYLDRGEPALAVAAYQGLSASQRADCCQDCGECQASCPKHLDIPARIRRTHNTVATFA